MTREGLETIGYAVPKADLIGITKALDSLPGLKKSEDGEEDGDAIAYYPVSQKSGKVSKVAIFRALIHSNGETYLVSAIPGLITKKFTFTEV